MKRICFFLHDEVPCHDGQAGDRQLGKTCQGCGQWVREGRTHCHGLPKSSKNARLGDEEVADVFVNSARVGIYIFAAVFHCRSKIIWSTHACRTSYRARRRGRRQAATSVGSRRPDQRRRGRVEDAVGRMRDVRPQAISLAELERAQKRAKDLDEDLMQEF